MSKHENPSDIVLESYEAERVLADNGLETVRHSSGHLQVTFGGTDYTNGYYVDIFTYFNTNSWFYGTFHAREKTVGVTVNPLGSLSHEGLELPIPSNTDQMLAAIYGPRWDTPDPAFTFITPESAGRRFYWWLNHYDPFREDWEDHHRGLISTGMEQVPSALAQWLVQELPPGSAVLELGCGLGTDSLFLADAGHRVLGVDYSRPAIARGARMASKKHVGDSSPDGSVHFEVVNVDSIRNIAGSLKHMAELAGPGTPVTVVSRNLFDNLHYFGRDNALLAISHLPDRGGRAYLQIVNPKFDGKSRNVHEPAGEKVFDPWEFTGRLASCGLGIIETNFFTEPSSPGSALSYALGQVHQ